MMKKKLLTLLLILSMIFTFEACGSDEPAADDEDTTQTAQQEEESKVDSEAPTTQNNNGVFEADEFTCVIKETSVEEDADGNPIVTIICDVTNHKDVKERPYTFWMLYVAADQESAATELEIVPGPLPEKYEENSDNLYAELKPGKTVTCAIGYNLFDVNCPVILTAYNDMFGEDVVGTYEIKLK